MHTKANSLKEVSIQHVLHGQVGVHFRSDVLTFLSHHVRYL